MPSDVLITPASSKIDFTDGSNATKRLNISGTAFSFNSNLNVLSSASLSSAFKAEGVNGTLFEVTDDLSNSLMSVNTIGGLPVFEVFANNSIIGGQYGANDFVISGNKIGLGYANPVNKLSVSGSVSIGSSYNVAAPSNGLIVQGDVGIGVTSFAYSNANRANLEMYGSGESLLALRNSTGNSYIQKSGADFYINNITNGFIAISNNGSERWRITNAGVFESNNAQTIRTSTGNLTLATNAGNGHVILSPHGTGNVGVGTATPSQKLEVQGNIKLGADNAGSYIYYVKDNEGTIIRTTRSDVSQEGLLRSDGWGNFTFNKSIGIGYSLGSSFASSAIGNGNLYVLNSIGINTTSPLTKLDVRTGSITSGTAASTSGSTIIAGYYSDTAGVLTVLGTEQSSGGPVLGYAVTPSTSATGAFLSSTTITIPRSAYTQDGGTHRWYIGASQTVAIGGAVTVSEVMRININGNVGIGTTSPSNRLDSAINIASSDYLGDANVYALAIKNYNATAGNAVGMTFGHGGYSYTNFVASIRTGTGANPKGDLVFGGRPADGSAFTENMRLQAGGNVGIGTTNPTNKLHVYSSDNELVFIRGTTAGAWINVQSSTSNLWSIGADGVNGFSVYNRNSNNYALIVRNDGNLGIGNITTASNKLHVNGSASIGSNYNTAAPTNGLIVEGSIGAGTTSPDLKVHIDAANAYPASSGTTPTGFLTLRAKTAGGTHGMYLGVANASPYGSWIQCSDSGNLATNYPLLLNPNGGSVGIGLTNPSYKLDVGAVGSGSISVRLTPGYERVRYYGFDLLGYNDGNLWMMGNNPTNTLLLSNNWDWDYQIAISYTPSTIGAAGGSLEIGQMTKNNANFTHGNTRFYTNGIERLRIINNGNVGIGISSPAARLHVNSTTSGATLLRTDGTNGTLFSVIDDLSDSLMSVNNSAGLPVLEVFADDRVVAGQYGANDFVLVNNKLGLGTNNPQYELDIVGPGTNAAVNIITRIRSSASSDTFNTGSVIAFTNTTTNVNAYSYIGSRIDLGGAGDNAQALIFATNATNTLPTEKMRIKSDGNVGIGTATPATLLQINTGTPISATGGIQFGDDTGTRLYRSASGIVTCSGTIAATFSGNLTGNVTGNATNVTGTVAITNGGTGATTAANARTNLGATTVGANLFILPNVTTSDKFLRVNFSDNTVSALDAAAFRTAIGAGTGNGNGTVTSVGGTGTVSGLTLSGTVTTTGNLTLGGTLSVTASNFASQTANTFLSAPNGAAGVPTFRAIVAADVPTLNQNTTGNANTASLATTSDRLTTRDNRTISPSEDDAYRLRFGFTSWANNDSSPYADYLHLRSYSDSSGGNDNLVMFRKDAIGMRIYQAGFGTSVAYSSFKDVAFTDQSFFIGTTSVAINRASAALTLNGVNISGTAASETFGTVTGRGASTATQITVSTSAGGSMYTGIKSGAGYSDSVSGATFKSITDHPTGGSFAFAAYYNGAPGTGTNSFYVGADGSGYFRSTLTTSIIKGDAGANYPHSFTNTDAGNTHWVNRSDRLLTSNGTNWRADGADPIMALVTSGNSNVTTIANSIGLALHNESQTNNTFSPAITFSNRSNSGAYNTTYAAIIGRKTGQGPDSNWSAGELHFYTMPVGAYVNNIPSLIINSAGNVGVGITAPTAKLNVLSTSSLSSVFKTEGVNGTLFEVTDDLSNSLMSVNTIGGLPVFEVFANNSIIAGQYGQNDFVISGNKVGIGTASPIYKLNVYDISSGSVDEVFVGTIGSDQVVGGRTGGSFGISTKSTSNGNLILTANSAMYLRTGGSNDRVFIKNDGNVGIGTVTPAYKLDVNGTSAFRDTVNIGPNIGTITWGNFGGGTGFGVRAESGRALSFGAGGSFDHLVINTAGRVGIGITSPSVKLAVDGEASFGDGSKLTMIGLDINSGVTPNFIKIRTKIPFTSGAADFTINIKGFRYGSAETANISICWHYYNSTFYNPAISSAGSFAPIVKLSAEDWDSSGTPKVCIVLVGPGYWPKLYVESMYSSNYNDDYADGWDWIDADATGTGNNLATLSYKSNFGNNFVMLGNGNVGIGTASPTTKLDIASTQANGIVMRFDTTTNYQAWIRPYWNSSTDSRIDFAINRTSGATPNVIMSVGYSDNVGIGTTTPATLLQIGTGTPTAATGGIQFGGDTGARIYRGGSNYIQTSSGLQSGAWFYAATYLQTGGNLIYPSSYSATQRLEVGNAANNGWIDGLTIAPGGNVVVAGTLTESSSIRYKENIKTIIAPILPKLNEIRPVTYNKKDNPNNIEYGIIAEELNDLFPELVNKNNNGEVESVNYSRLTVLLIKAVKELKQEIEILKNK